MIHDILQSALRTAAQSASVHPTDLCIVGRPELVRELRTIGIRADAVPGIPTYDMGGGRFNSDVHIIMRHDLWTWRGRGMRAKVLRGL